MFQSLQCITCINDILCVLQRAFVWWQASLGNWLHYLNYAHKILAKFGQAKIWSWVRPWLAVIIQQVCPHRRPTWLSCCPITRLSFSFFLASSLSLNAFSLCFWVISSFALDQRETHTKAGNFSHGTASSFTLYFCSLKHLLWEAFSHAAINVRLFVCKQPPLFIAKYSFTDD